MDPAHMEPQLHGETHRQTQNFSEMQQEPLGGLAKSQKGAPFVQGLWVGGGKGSGPGRMRKCCQGSRDGQGLWGREQRLGKLAAPGKGTSW